MRRALAAALLVALALPGAASAHARLLASTPGDGQDLRTPPSVAVLQFDERIAVGPGNAVVDSHGRTALAGVPRTRDHVLTLPLTPLATGSYTIRWSVVSDDGHDVSGIVAFAVGAATPHATLTARGNGPAAGDVLDRWLLLAGILVAAGASAFAVFVAYTRRVAVLAGAAFGVAAAGAALEWSRVPGGTRFGHAMLVVLVAAVIGVAAAAVTVVSAFPPPLLVVPALVAIGATSAGGHVLDDGVPRYQLAVDVLHLAAASVWIGGLVSLALTASPAAARRFSRLALTSVAVIAVTGAFRAVSELSTLHQVWSTGYGRALVAKSALLAALVVLGYRSRKRVLRRRPGLRRAVAAELLPAGLLVTAVAVLTAVAPGRVAGGAPPLAGAGPPPAPPAGALTLAGQLGSYGVAVAVSPGAAATPARVTVIGSQGDGVDGLRVRLAGRPTSPCGHGCYAATVPAVRLLRVAVGRSSLEFALPPPPYRDGRRILRQIGERLLRARTVAFHERLASGPGQVVTSRWRLEAPASLAYTASDGSQGVIIGGRRWDRQRRGRWLASPQTPKVPQPQLPWPAFPSDVVELRPAVFAGREVERVSFVDPRTPAWYTVSADARTHVVVRVDMVAPAHFMRDEYTTLDAPFRIRPPR